MGKERRKKEAGPSSFVAGSFNEHRNLQRRLDLGAGQRETDLETACHNLENLFRGLNWTHSHVPSR